jgi:hypothetical protein
MGHGQMVLEVWFAWFIGFIGQAERSGCLGLGWGHGLSGLGCHLFIPFIALIIMSSSTVARHKHPSCTSTGNTCRWWVRCDTTEDDMCVPNAAECSPSMYQRQGVTSLFS